MFNFSLKRILLIVVSIFFLWGASFNSVFSVENLTCSTPKGCYCIDEQQEELILDRGLNESECREKGTEQGCQWFDPNAVPRCQQEEQEDQGSSLDLNPSKLNKLQTGGGATDSIATLIGRSINILLQVIGTLGFVIFIYGAFLVMTSQGQKDKYMKGINVMWWGGIGLGVILTSYAIVNFIMRAF